MEYLISAFEWFFIGYTGLILIAIALAVLGKGKITVNRFDKPKNWILPVIYVISIFVYFLN
jgi:hypothetical protein